MKTTIFTTVLLALLLAFAVACWQNQLEAGDTTNIVTAANENRTTATPIKSQLDDKTREALLDALADERRAQATYEAVIAKFGDARPFSNIVNAEKRHESFLLPLFERYAAEVPQNEFSKEKMKIPATLTEACKQGIEGEKANITMYDRFLEFVKEKDIRETFTYLRDASKNNHLPAFERCAEGRKMGDGRGKGRQF